MKKVFLIFIICFLFLGCSEKVQSMTEYQESYGKRIEFYKNDNTGKYEYLVLIPDSYLGIQSKMRIDHYLNDGSENSQIFENIQVGEIYRENGVIKSVIINDKKYVNK